MENSISTEVYKVTGCMVSDSDLPAFMAGIREGMRAAVDSNQLVRLFALLEDWEHYDQ